MLSAKGLTCVRGERRLFAGLDLSIDAGEWLHVRGENGSGKTSLLRMLAGLAQPADGDIFWNQHTLAHAEDDYRQQRMFLGHHGALKEELTPLENLKFAAELDGAVLPDAEALTALHRFGLKGREELAVRFLSAGQKRRVLLARLLTRKASLWILDEPFTALDLKGVEMLSALIGQHLEAGGMAILTSHQSMPMPGGRVVQL